MKTISSDQRFDLNYKLLIGSIVPRPIALISTKNEDGSNNLAPFSFFTAVSASPMIIAFSPMIRTSTSDLKDTPKNIFREKELVINFVHEELADKVNLCSTETPFGDDEFILSGLTPIPSENVKAMRVKESLIHFECIYRDHLSYGDTPGAGQIITAEVVKIHVDESIYDDGRIITKKFKPLGRGAGNDWIRVTDVFELQRLMASQIQK